MILPPIQPVFKAQSKPPVYFGHAQDGQDNPIGNFKQVDAQWFRGAQPGASKKDDNCAIDIPKLRAGLEYLRDIHGIRVILNLRHPGELGKVCPLEAERHIIDELNRSASPDKKLIYLELPLYYPTALRLSDAEQLLHFFKTMGQQKVFVHCRHGRDRTGNVTGLYQAFKHKLPFDQIVKQMIERGYSPNGAYRIHLQNMAWALRVMPEYRAYYKAYKSQIDRY